MQPVQRKKTVCAVVETDGVAAFGLCLEDIRKGDCLSVKFDFGLQIEPIDAGFHDGLFHLRLAVGLAFRRDEPVFVDECLDGVVQFGRMELPAKLFGTRLVVETEAKFLHPKLQGLFGHGVADDERVR